MNEEKFRDAVRTVIARGTYPHSSTIRRLLGLRELQPRSGLKGEQTRWRVQEMERAGYDWEASKRAQRLIRRASPDP